MLLLAWMSIGPGTATLAQDCEPENADGPVQAVNGEETPGDSPAQDLQRIQKDLERIQKDLERIQESVEKNAPSI